MTYDSWHLTRIVGWGYIQGTKCSEKKILKIHFPELVQIFAFQKLVLNNWRILSWKKWWVPTIFYNKSLFQPLGSCTLRYSVRHLQVFTELFHLAMKSPVDPTAGTFFEKKTMDRSAFGFKRQIYTHKTKLRYSDKLLKKKLSRFIKTTPSWKRCQNITISQKIISGKPHRFKPLTSGVGSSTVTGGGSKHFWMKRCTAARGSADNSNLKASTNSWFCWRDWWSWSFQLKIFPWVDFRGGIVSWMKELNMKVVLSTWISNILST